MRETLKKSTILKESNMKQLECITDSFNSDLLTSGVNGGQQHGGGSQKAGW
ncbi:MAG TPA: hypothetical protein VGN86_06120 [Pyrinomonadaceae bacterium]|jgi:hypothetical protein|nr:hypothetical protein [Pyrinomonadaceae bacterium]